MGTNSTITLTVGGLTRTAQLHIPDQYSASGPALPVVFGFHGGGGSGGNFAGTKWSHMQDQGWIMVFPDAVDHGGQARWIIPGEASQYPGEDDQKDIDFFDALLAHINTNYNAGDKYATGFSSGGKMAWALYGHRSDVLSGVAPVARVRPSEVPSPLNALPSFYAWGKNDSSGDNTQAGFQDSAAWLLGQHGLGVGSPNAQTTTNSCTGKVQRRSYTPANERVRVHFHKKGGHKWEECGAYSTASEVIAFFEAV